MAYHMETCIHKHKSYDGSNLAKENLCTYQNISVYWKKTMLPNRCKCI